jgi:hypothetical protein
MTWKKNISCATPQRRNEMTPSFFGKQKRHLIERYGIDSNGE